MTAAAVCRVCRHPLRAPASRAAGIGPICRRNTAPQPAAVAAVAVSDGAHGRVTGQTAIPLQPQLPTGDPTP
ncbi:DUF6011 domain-containing protein [Streptomyces sp. MP131-18]|uniref:DUF6011 domain-containing protein n=1 Tax=Streptomyces sp. MP131-18 TaxID=1857892 RepID=UPI0009D2823B|nr:hypothetical protein STBA_01870 [Streptomyces sp. MP131-18]